jgi:hypothetical protein
MGGVGGDHAAGIENRCTELCLSRLASPFVAGSTHSLNGRENTQTDPVQRSY